MEHASNLVIWADRTGPAAQAETTATTWNRRGVFFDISSSDCRSAAIAHQLDAPVPRAAFDRRVRLTRPARAVAHRAPGVRVHAVPLGQAGSYRLGAAAGKRLVGGGG